MKKLLFLILTFLLITSCKKAKVNDTSYQNPSESYEYVDSLGGTKLGKVEEPYQPRESSKKYSFIVFHTRQSYTNNTGVSATGVFETSSYLSEDEKYKLLDEAQHNIYDNVTKRELKTYDSYAEASKAREKVLHIR